MKIASWNVNGWNEYNYSIREILLKKFNFDIWLIVETHLRNDEQIHVQGFKWIGQNRFKYKRPSGGLGFLVSLELYSQYDVTILDMSVN